MNQKDEVRLWVVIDDENHWLYYGRDTIAGVIAGAKKAADYTPEATLYLYAIATEIVIEP